MHLDKNTILLRSVGLQLSDTSGTVVLCSDGYVRTIKRPPPDGGCVHGLLMKVVDNGDEQLAQVRFNEGDADLARELAGRVGAPTEPGWYRCRLIGPVYDWTCGFLQGDGLLRAMDGALFGPDLTDWEWAGRVSMPREPLARYGQLWVRSEETAAGSSLTSAAEGGIEFDDDGFRDEEPPPPALGGRVWRNGRFTFTRIDGTVLRGIIHEDHHEVRDGGILEPEELQRLRVLYDAVRD